VRVGRMRGRVGFALLNESIAGLRFLGLMRGLRLN
jgi:hypothetical protein